MKHLMNVPFTGLGIRKGFRGNRWLKNRIRIFSQFVLPSLMNQSRQEFTLWISWRPEEESNKIVSDFKRSLDGIRGLKTIFTYGGLCFYDDKFAPFEAKDRLLKNLQLTLPHLEQEVAGSDFVYMTIQPSDDMYLGDTVEVIQSIPPEKNRAVGFTQGYIMNYATKEIAEYDPDTLPPFYTIMFPTEIFLNPFDHMRYTGPYASHEFVKEKFKFVPIQGRGFVVGVHGENISTVWNHPYKGRILTDSEKEEILIKCGVYFSDPVIGRRGMRLLARKVLNILPFQSSLRSVYHRLPTYVQIF